MTSQLGIFVQDNTSKLITMDPDYLQKELGLILRQKQDAATIKAIAKPEDFIAERSKKIGELFGTWDANTKKVINANGKVSVFFKARLDEYNALGLPSEVARKMAERSAQRFYEDELELLELEMPGYSQSFQTATVDHNAKIDKNEIAGNDFDRKAYKKKLKKKLKAKYANQ